MNLSHLNAEQVPSLWFPLVKKFYQAHYPSGKPNKADPIWVLKDKSTILCAVRLKQWPTFQLLTGMVTEPSSRNQGLASHLLQSIHPALLQKTTYCFAFSERVSLYESNHFTTITVEMLPKELANRFRAYTTQGRNLTPMHYIYN